MHQFIRMQVFYKNTGININLFMLFIKNLCTVLYFKY